MAISAPRTESVNVTGIVACRSAPAMAPSAARSTLSWMTSAKRSPNVEADGPSADVPEKSNPSKPNVVAPSSTVPVRPHASYWRRRSGSARISKASATTLKCTAAARSPGLTSG